MTYTYTLPRSGCRPLRFTGSLLTSGDTQADNGPGNTRWWSVAVYRTDADRYILALNWHTRWQGEISSQTAEIYDALEAVADALEAHDPLCRLIGFPVSGNGKYAARQRHIETVLRQAWAELVGDVLGELGVEERL